MQDDTVSTADQPLSANAAEPNVTTNTEPSRSTNVPRNILVNLNGSFEHDRVIKHGTVLKRTQRTKKWRKVYLVLRPQTLSIYRDIDETQLRHRVLLADLTAVTRQKDPKGRVRHVFAVFAALRTYYLAASEEAEAQAWVETLRREARLDHDGVEDPEPPTAPYGEGDTAVYSSSDAEQAPRPRVRSTQQARSSTMGTQAMSAQDHFSYSDTSDTAAGWTGLSSLSLALPDNDQASNRFYGVDQTLARSRSFTDGETQVPTDIVARVACHGWVRYLKVSAHLKSWKRVWMVLRPQSLALYKDDDEYSALQIVAFGNIVDAIDIDPISRSKQCCMQIITEDKDYKFCAPDEDSLARWLGCFKSLLAKRRDLQSRRTT